ncbi:MAG: hypothetical protein WCA78_15235, partial [Rhizomicrobium sp.]
MYGHRYLTVAHKAYPQTPPHLIDRSVIGLQNAFAAQCRPRKVKRRQGLVGGPRGVNGGVQQ